MGICRYTEIGLDGTAKRKMRTTGQTDGAWNYSLLDLVKIDGVEEQNLNQVGTVHYGDDGLAIEETWSSVTGTEDGCLMRIPVAELPIGPAAPKTAPVETSD